MTAFTNQLEPITVAELDRVTGGTRFPTEWEWPRCDRPGCEPAPSPTFPPPPFRDLRLPVV